MLESSHFLKPACAQRHYSDKMGMKGGSLPPPHTRRVSPGGEPAEAVVNGAADSAHPVWDAGALPALRAQRTLRGWVMTKPLRFRKKKRGRKLCKTGVSQAVTLSLYTVLLNGGEVWEQGNQEGVLVPLLLPAEPVTQVPVGAVAVHPPQAAHGNCLPGPMQSSQDPVRRDSHTKHTSDLLPRLLAELLTPQNAAGRAGADACPMSSIRTRALRACSFTPQPASPVPRCRRAAGVLGCPPEPGPCAGGQRVTLCGTEGSVGWGAYVPGHR